MKYYITIGGVCALIWLAFVLQEGRVREAKEEIIEAQNQAHKEEMDALDDLKPKPEIPTPEPVPVQPPPVELPWEYRR
jgi:hypothetical protein